MSITGMSSLMGYTRLHCPHFSAVPFLTSATGVLQFGQARISRNSGATGIGGLYDTFALLWNNSLYETGVPTRIDPRGLFGADTGRRRSGGTRHGAAFRPGC